MVDVGSQKSCIAVTFHQLKNVLLQETDSVFSHETQGRKFRRDAHLKQKTMLKKGGEVKDGAEGGRAE